MWKTGLDMIGAVAWGSHFCQFYQTREDLLDILVPHFRAGRENSEFCVRITSHPLRAEEAKAALAAVVPDLEQRIAAGRIEILDCHQWYVLTASSMPSGCCRVARHILHLPDTRVVALSMFNEVERADRMRRGRRRDPPAQDRAVRRAAGRHWGTSIEAHDGSLRRSSAQPKVQGPSRGLPYCHRNPTPMR
jgi:hypothetical protein